MDESYSESDVSLSPSQILERLQVLRQLQLMQRGKLQKHRLQYKETSETSSSITEILSHFSNSTSYNTFQSLLQSSNDISNEVTPRINLSNISQKVLDKDLVEGVSVLNLSQESEFIVNSPLSNRSKTFASSKSKESSREIQAQHVSHLSQDTAHKISETSDTNRLANNKQISLDDMPILSPKNDFEQLLLEKLKDENSVPKDKIQLNESLVPDKSNSKRPYLKRGEGIARFGLKRNAIVIQNTKSLPWKRRNIKKSSTESPIKQSIKMLKNKKKLSKTKALPLTSEVEIPNLAQRNMSNNQSGKSQEISKLSDKSKKIGESLPRNEINVDKSPENATGKNESTSNGYNLQQLRTTQKVAIARNAHPLVTNKGKTWAAVLTKEQNDFLRQLKQSDYYKNFASPTKSVISNVSYDESMYNLRHERETAEQNMFDLIENKVSHDSFNLENSFFNHFLKKGNIEYSGESTPLVLQKCLSENPDLMHIFPGLKGERKEDSHSDAETCCSNYTNCCSDACSSISCCSCKTAEHTPNKGQNPDNPKKNKKSIELMNQKEVNIETKNTDNTVTEDVMKENIAEMNAKLVATSDLLKDRLHELEDEIDTFRKENATLAKLREEVDQEKQKFYQEKAAFEQKINEEKVLAEYYLAEEKDKLAKQKQMYDRYIREMRGRLNKKEKDEVVNLKKEISDLKEEIRIKDIKSTSTIARLRNQIKIMEKEKKDLQDEVEKLKKENRRIQHNNEVTRRLTNIKYLEEINKKLTNMSCKNTRSEISVDHDIKYKSYEIERQSRSTKREHFRGTSRPLPRAKSVPNLKVTSRYAKYFSQRDAASQIEQNKYLNVKRLINNTKNNYLLDNNDSGSNKSLEDDNCSGDEIFLEKNYNDTFKTYSPKSNRSSGSDSNLDNDIVHPTNCANDFFLQKSNSSSIRNTRSPNPNRSNYMKVNRKSPTSILTSKSSKNATPNSDDYVLNKSSSNNSNNLSQSPLSTFNHSSPQPVTIIDNNQYGDKLMTVSPEPAISKTSLTKTNLNPTEFRKPDGSRELRFPNGNVKYISSDEKYSKFVYYNGDIKENFYNEGRIKYYYAETKTYHTTHADGLEVLEFPDGQVEKRYKDGSSEIRLPNGSIRYFDPKNKHVREEWRFPDGAALTVAANGERRIVFSNRQVEVHAQDHKRREFPDGTVKLVYNDGTSETRYASGRVRIKDKHGNLIMDSAPG